MTIPQFKYNRYRPPIKRRPVYYQPGNPLSPATKSGKRKMGLVKLTLPYAAMFGAAGLLFILTAFAWYSRNLPRPDKIIDRTIAQSTKIFDRTGEHLLFAVHGAENRTLVPLGDIPDFVKWATILVEDKKFYEHQGFDLRGIARSVLMDILTARAAQGGSTLTQQLIKNALLSNEKALARKIKELVLAYRIEQKFSKDQILQMYFNEIPYGGTAYGIESASQLYFKKSVKDLSIAEGAALAALPKAPSYYSPYGQHKDELLSRKDYIIGLLEKDGKITAGEAAAARNEALNFAKRESIMFAPHFVMFVKGQLADKYGGREVEQGGLKVITTLDYDMQAAAEEAVATYAERNEKSYGATNAALAAIDPKTGQILAMVGSRDYFDTERDGNFNVAASGLRQPGSSFKPFVYLVGLEKGYTDKTTLWDVVMNFGVGANNKPYQPHNYDLKERGPVSLRNALAQSLNIPAVEMLYLAGPAAVINRAREFGYTTFADPDRYGLALVLGGAEVKLLEHAAAYAALASEGVRRPTVSVLKVENSRGEVLEEWEETQGEQAAKPEVVRILTDIISDNAARAPVFGAKNYLTLPGRSVAAKTGTTNDYRDAWTMGYTPQLAAGVWVGNNNFTAMKRGADGSVVAAPIWNYFMKKALTDKPVEGFAKPDIKYPDKPVLRGDLEKGITVKIDRASGLLASELTPSSFIVEKKIQTGHNILHYVKKDDPLGPEPTPAEWDVQYPSWEAAVQKWLKKKGWQTDAAIPTEYDNLHLVENKPTIGIVSPSEGQAFALGSEILFKVETAAPRGVARVEFSVDDKLVGAVRTAPYELRYVPDATTTTGQHTLRAISYDDIDNSETTSVNFNLR